MLEITNYPEIKTERLQLGKISFQDVPKIVGYAGNKKIADMTLNIPHPYTEKDAVFWINSANQGFENKSQYTFGIRLKTTNEFIGGMGLKMTSRFDRAELGYWIAEPFWNKGFATEALGGVLHYGFRELGLHKIFAIHLEENPASGKVLLKNGMIKEGELKDHVKKDKSFRSVIQYRLTVTEYDAI